MTYLTRVGEKSESRQASIILWALFVLRATDV